MENTKLSKRQFALFIIMLITLCWIMLGVAFSQSKSDFFILKNDGYYYHLNFHTPALSYIVKVDTIRVIVLLADTSTTFYYQYDDRNHPEFHSNVIYGSRNSKLGFLTTINFAWCIRKRKVPTGNIYYGGSGFSFEVETTYLDYYSHLPFPKSVFIYLLRECE